MDRTEPYDVVPAGTGSTVTEEIDAIAAVYEALKDLDKDAQVRVISWLSARLGLRSMYG